MVWAIGMKRNNKATSWREEQKEEERIKINSHPSLVSRAGHVKRHKNAIVPAQSAQGMLQRWLVIRIHSIRKTRHFIIVRVLNVNFIILKLFQGIKERVRTWKLKENQDWPAISAWRILLNLEKKTRISGLMFVIHSLCWVRYLSTIASVKAKLKHYKWCLKTSHDQRTRISLKQLRLQWL